MTFEHLDDQQPFVPDDKFRAAALHEGRRRRRRRLSFAAGSTVAVLAVLVGLLLVAAPGTDPDRVDVPPAETTTTTTSSATSITTAPSVTSTTTTRPAPAVIEEQDSPFFFDSPSHNIGCVMATGEGEHVRCDVLRYTYTPPPSVEECPVDYGYTLRLRPGEPGYFGCSGDYVGGAGPVLEYGTGARVGSVTCVSASEGITCTEDDGHGFFISREAYRLF